MRWYMYVDQKFPRLRLESDPDIFQNNAISVCTVKTTKTYIPTLHVLFLKSSQSCSKYSDSFSNSKSDCELHRYY